MRDCIVQKVIRERLAAASPAERRLIASHLRVIAPTLEEVFGPNTTRILTGQETTDASIL